MWFSVALMKFHWSGINWHVLNQSECRNCCLYIIIQKIAPQAKSGKYFQIWFFPRFGGKKWRRSEHAHASYPGLFFRPSGFSPYMGREESRVQGLDYIAPCLISKFLLLGVLDPLRHRSALRKIAKDTFALTHGLLRCANCNNNNNK